MSCLVQSTLSYKMQVRLLIFLGITTLKSGLTFSKRFIDSRTVNKITKDILIQREANQEAQTFH